MSVVPLVLRHASKRDSGTWGPDDYDVLHASGGVVGCIMKPQAAAPSAAAWEWAITGAAVVPIVPNSGSAATKDEAKAELAQTWRT